MILIFMHFKHLIIVVCLGWVCLGQHAGENSTDPTHNTTDGTNATDPPTQEEDYEHGNHYHTMKDKEFWINSGIALFLCCLAGFCSGNTVGLLSIDPLELEIKLQNGTPQQKQSAKVILQVLHNHHLLLVTLLLYNAIAMQTLPLVVHTIVPAWLAIVLSTAFGLIFGEIIPQAMCTGPNKLKIARTAVPLIRVMIKLFWIFSYPIGKLLDRILGEHSNHRIERKDFTSMLKMQDQSTLKSSEILLLSSILKLREHRVGKILIPINQAYMVSSEDKIDQAKIEEIKKKEYSFIPVYRDKKSNIVAILKIKELVPLVADKKNVGKKVKELIQLDDNMLTIYEDTNLMELLMLFEAKKARLALVANKKRKVQAGLNSIYYSKSDMILEKGIDNIQISGIATLNNVFEELTGIEEAETTTSGSDLTNPPKEDKADREMDSLKKPLIMKP